MGFLFIVLWVLLFFLFFFLTTNFDGWEVSSEFLLPNLTWTNPHYVKLHISSLISPSRLIQRCSSRPYCRVGQHAELLPQGNIGGACAFVQYEVFVQQSHRAESISAPSLPREKKHFNNKSFNYKSSSEPHTDQSRCLLCNITTGTRTKCGFCVL